jgi:hypothetical protein
LIFVFTAIVSPGAHRKRWIYLEDAHGDESVDHKTIHVGGSERFHRIQLPVNGG